MSVWARALLFHLKEQIIKYYFKSNLGCKYANRFVILDYDCLGEERIFRKKALIAELKKNNLQSRTPIFRYRIISKHALNLILSVILVYILEFF